MFQDDQTLQNQLFAMSYRDLVSEDSDAWLYVDLFETLDVGHFHSDYQEQGQTAKEPRLMLRTLFYGLTHGVVSGRKLQEVCRNDNRFIVLSGNLRKSRDVRLVRITNMIFVNKPLFI
jgi:transposase